MRILPFILFFVSTFSLAQATGSPKIIKEQSGHITNYRAEGSLESTHAIGCIPLAKAKNIYTPPDLYKGVSECLAQNKYDLSAELFALAGIYSRFDAERITDKSAVQGGKVLVINTFLKVPADKKAKLSDMLRNMAKDPDILEKLCSDVRQVGMPNYYPDYLILHGVKSFTGNPHNGALAKNFDSQGVWKNLQSEYLHCPP